ncbi:hypothetical protein [Massilia sp. MS-15]|uniref:hypothetical protein n=1 Tax=Massilia sp. MS-15 TaxID=2878200 RepID=UPI001CD7857F|nr:hypothetical protein [Massilia sp. MS-15]MCA1245578.1 hypothetical protein [Massilia sp. MS-15]
MPRGWTKPSHWALALFLVLVLAAIGWLAHAAHAAHQAREPAAQALLPPAPLLEGGLDNPAFLAWLGPLPRGLTQASLDARLEAVANKIVKDMSDEPALARFRCKTPAEIGNVALMNAVEAYIDGLPESRDDDKLLHGLNEAARNGNWVARAQLFLLLSERRDADLATQYRSVQLMEWMYERRLGSLYAYMGDAIAASGFYQGHARNEATGPELFAALHGSYPAQFKVGAHLRNSDDPQHARIGKRMQDCALASLPAFARVFTGEAEQARARRREHAHEASFQPLHRAVRDRDRALVERLLAMGSTDVNGKTGRGQTALDLAFLGTTPDAAIIGALIAHGADVAGNGAVDKRAGPHDDDELLNRAVKARPVDLDVIAMLVRAGAEPFKTTEVNDFIGATPFRDAFDAYESGENTEVLDFFLRTGKLDPRSELAAEYLEDAVAYPKVMARLLAYGIAPEHAEDLLSEFAQASVRAATPVLRQRYIDKVSELVRTYPALLRAVRGEAGSEALDQAAYVCNFEYASWLLDTGAVPDASRSHAPGTLLSTVVDRCDKEHARDPDLDALADRDRWRQVFLEKLKAKRYDFNARVGRCPAWSSNGSLCEAPEDDALLALLLKLGADPYLLYPDQDDSALASVIQRCRRGMVDLMLARPPARLDAQVRQGLALALEETTREPWSGLHCPPDFMSNTARKLVSYGAQPGARP